MKLLKRSRGEASETKSTIVSPLKKSSISGAKRSLIRIVILTIFVLCAITLGRKEKRDMEALKEKRISSVEDSSGFSPACKDVGVDSVTGPILRHSQTDPSFSMKLHSKDEVMSKLLLEHGCMECAFLNMTMRLLQKHPDAYLIDIGGNLGLFSLAAAASKRHVYTFEPFRHNYQRICASIALNPTFEEYVHLQTNALSDVPAKMQVYFGHGKYNYGALVVAPLSNDTKGKPEEVEALQLDSLGHLFPRNRPVVIKVDVEGSDCRALVGGLNVIKELNVIFVSTEFSVGALRNNCPRRTELFSMLEQDLGLVPYMLVSNGHGSTVQLDLLNTTEWEEWHLPGKKRTAYDVLWVRPGDPLVFEATTTSLN